MENRNEKTNDRRNKKYNVEKATAKYNRPGRQATAFHARRPFNPVLQDEVHVPSEQRNNI